MQDAVTEYIDAPPATLWALVSDVTQTHRYSEETFEAEWLDGATGPAVGVRFRGHVKRNGRGPTYWTVCRVTACEQDREFGFEVLAGSRSINNWHYRFEPAGEGTDVTESFRLTPSLLTKVYWGLAGWARRKTNRANMRATLQNIRAVAESVDR
ncbi:SRPBCC family protein [Actinomycetospora endophytica]|uniref:SRPBCC family protein n=1 Tax=Actinomycetospora endophytica TaxID=2291215 RepID=A0ABS8P3J3_9PSEU|nr:SRPBCC family protein [Actinomycetospora endophytica]MCD2192613.1 SRPBCC family protein [Actinomycetospora endophytica]